MSVLALNAVFNLYVVVSFVTIHVLLFVKLLNVSELSVSWCNAFLVWKVVWW